MDDPWFTTYRGRGKLQITPRNGKGWAALVGFIVAVTLPSLGVGWLVERSAWLLVPFLAFILLLTIAFIRWAMAHSEVVNLDMTARELAEFREWKRRGKR